MGLNLSFNKPIFYSIAQLSIRISGLAFRKYSYMTTSIIFDLTTLLASDNPNNSVCLNTGCRVTLVDKDQLFKKLQKINKIATSLKVRGISTSKHELDVFTLVSFYIPNFNQEDPEVNTYIKCELHLVQFLKANMLIYNDIFQIKSLFINYVDASAHILIYEVDIIMTAKSHS